MNLKKSFKNEAKERRTNLTCEFSFYVIGNSKKSNITTKNIIYICLYHFYSVPYDALFLRSFCPTDRPRLQFFQRWNYTLNFSFLLQFQSNKMYLYFYWNILIRNFRFVSMNIFKRIHSMHQWFFSSFGLLEKMEWKWFVFQNRLFCLFVVVKCTFFRLSSFRFTNC